MALVCEKGCGKCCEVGGTRMTLPVTKEEARAVAAALGREIVELVVPPPLRGQAAHCPAYDIDTRACMAYDARPQVCRDFQCNGEEAFAHSSESRVKLIKLSLRPEPVADLRDYLPETVERVMARHERIAFQFSGGKDSTAAIFFMRKYWDRMTVYHCDSGDEMPETTEIVQKVAAMVPKFVLVEGRVAAAQKTFGLPVDLMPWTSAYAAHQLNAGFTPLMQDRVACCFRSVMEPLHERMQEDKITLVVRGQKDSDKMKGPLRSGDQLDGFEFLYPIQNWTDEQCFSYMRENGIEPQKFYSEGMTHSADCATCTAWMEDDRGAYLKKHHPLKFQQYKRNMQAIWGAVAPALVHLTKEVEACDG